MLLPSGNPIKCHEEVLPCLAAYMFRPKRFVGCSEGLDVCVCCAFFPFILDIKFVGRTSRGHTGGRSHRIFHPPSFCGAYLNFSGEKDSAIPFPRPSSTVKSNFVYRSPLVGHFFYYFPFFSEKNPVYRDRTRVSTCQKVTRLPLSYRVDTFQFLFEQT